MTESQRPKERIEMITLHKILFVFCFLSLSLNYYISTKPMLEIENPTFSLIQPNETITSKFSDNYDQLIDIKKFSFKINPKPCKRYPEGFLLMIIVSSNPLNYENRLVIRKTWGQTDESTNIVFLVGETDNVTVSQKIQEESVTYGDIVQGNFKDAYHNMTYKHVMGLKWISHHCMNSKYILKTDDDIVVNADELKRFLVRRLSPWGAKGLIMCKVAKHALAQRRQSSKWMVTLEEYPMPFYPDYCPGWAILYSRDVVPRLLEAAQNTPYFWIDDVHITGILAQKIGVPRTSITNYVLTEKKAEMLIKSGRQNIGRFLFGPPNLKVQRMSALWRAISQSCHI
ncbi:glycosyltransferase [Bombyx mori]|uniref:Hexosyltransferase n=1 Tax=Bombyx mori TaxID=7091 RepID=G1UHW3_BOMMO|nr:glycosyltransferase [Bombyx mori]BAK82122.1 glycosyltransferase [Bombyx mori]